MIPYYLSMFLAYFLLLQHHTNSDCHWVHFLQGIIVRTINGHSKINRTHGLAVIFESGKVGESWSW